MDLPPLPTASPRRDENQKGTHSAGGSAYAGVVSVSASRREDDHDTAIQCRRARLLTPRMRHRCPSRASEDAKFWR